jgi:glycosyltransferase involved in cell wall biosynthesis
MTLLRVAHIITGLEVGGAERMLQKVVAHLDRDAFRSDVISLAPPGPLADAVAAVSDRLEFLGMRPRVTDVAKLARLRRLLREWQPDVVQTWMYHANLAGGLAARLSVRAPVIWNIVASGYSYSERRRAQVVPRIVRLSAAASRFIPSRTVYCSRRAIGFHHDLGFSKKGVEFIPTAFDVETFRPDPDARRSVRRELQLDDDARLVGLVARFHPIKNHDLFLTAARAIADQRSDTHFVLCGDGLTPDNAAVMDIVRRHGVADRCHLLGRRTDMPRITAALDLACSSSFGEGFPNTLGEAMACGVPCVATDVGDSAYLIDDTGMVVPRDDASAFANACLELLGDPARRTRLGAAARQRIEEQFEIGAIARQYERLYRDAVKG